MDRKIIAPHLSPGFTPPDDWPKYCATCGGTTLSATLGYDPYSGEAKHGMICFEHRVPYIWDPEWDKPDDDDDKRYGLVPM